MSGPLTEEQKQRAREMRRAGESYYRIAGALDSNYVSIRRLLEPGYRERCAKQQRESKWGRYKPKGAREFPRSITVPIEVEVERAQRINTSRTLTSTIMGDPPPGYSALDQKRREGRA